MRGDWLYHKLVWQFSSRWNRLRDICYLCDCKGRSPNEGDLFWNLDGQWLEYDRVDFLLRQLGNRPRPCALVLESTQSTRNLECDVHAMLRPIAPSPGLAS